MTRPVGVTAYDVADHYDRAYFDDLVARYRTRNRFARQRIANVFRLLPDVAGKTLVDIGCGMGTFTVEAARHGAHGIGVDPAVEAVRAAKRVAAAEGVAATEGAATPEGAAGAERVGAKHVARADFIQADAALLPLPDASCDIVLAADMTEHLDDDTLGRILAEAHRALRPGGSIVIYTPEQSHLFERLKDSGVMTQDPSHIGIRSAAELSTALRGAGFDVRPVRYLPSHLPIWNMLERGLGRWVPLLRRRIGLVATRGA
ncbi:MAG TPA: class I SAM-dependent methyltransferase [Longimicrobiales bacterium]